LTTKDAVGRKSFVQLDGGFEEVLMLLGKRNLVADADFDGTVDVGDEAVRLPTRNLKGTLITEAKRTKSPANDGQTQAAGQSESGCSTALVADPLTANCRMRPNYVLP
jgi:hypothetical protein